MIHFALILAAIAICQVMQAVDDLLSHIGVVSLLHGGLLGYGQVYVAKRLLEWGGFSLGWLVVGIICITALLVSLYKIHKTGSRWIFAFNFGIFCGILYGGFDLV